MGPLVSFATQEGQDRRLMPAKPIEVALNEIVTRARVFTDAGGAAIALRDGNELVTRASSGTIAPPVGARSPIEGSLTGQVVVNGALVHIEDSDNDPRVDAEVCRSINTRSFIVTPISGSTSLVGVLAVFAPTPHAFTRTDIAVLRTMADQISPLLAGVSFPAETPAGAPVRTEAPLIEEPEPVAPPIESSATERPELLDPALPPEPIAPPAAKPIAPPAPAAFQPPRPKQPEFVPMPPAPKAPEVVPMAEAFERPTHVRRAPTPAPQHRSTHSPQTHRRPDRIEPVPVRQEAVTELAPAPVAEPTVAPTHVEPVRKAPAPAPRAPRPAARPEKAAAPPVSEPEPEVDEAPAAKPKEIAWSGLTTVEPKQKATGKIVAVAAAALLIAGGVFGWPIAKKKFFAPKTVAVQPAPAPVASLPVPDPGAASATSKTNSVVGTVGKPSQPAQAAAAAQSQPKPAQATERPAPKAIELQAASMRTNKVEDAAPPQLAFAVQGPNLPASASVPKLVPAKTEAFEAQVMRKVSPAYPEMAKRLRIGGKVVVRAHVLKDGTVGQTDAASGPVMLREAAGNAVKQWRFRPAQINGTPVESNVQVVVEFTAPN